MELTIVQHPRPHFEVNSYFYSTSIT